MKKTTEANWYNPFSWPLWLKILLFPIVIIAGIFLLTGNIMQFFRGIFIFFILIPLWCGLVFVHNYIYDPITNPNKPTEWVRLTEGKYSAREFEKNPKVIIRDYGLKVSSDIFIQCYKTERGPERFIPAEHEFDLYVLTDGYVDREEVKKYNADKRPASEKKFPTIRPEPQEGMSYTEYKMERRAIQREQKRQREIERANSKI